MINNPLFASLLPYKSTAVALLFSVIFGPVGLLYASFWGGLVMIILGIVVISSKFYFTMFLFWLVCCIWSVGAVETYNRQILMAHLQKQTNHV